MLHDQNNGIPCVCHITRTDSSFIKMVKLLTLSSSPFQMQTLTPDALTCTCSLATWSCMRAFNGETTKTKLPRIFYICPSACTKSKLVGKNIDKSEIYHTQWLILPKCQFHGQLYFSASKLNSYCLYHLLLYLFQTILQHTLKEHHLVSHFVLPFKHAQRNWKSEIFGMPNRTVPEPLLSSSLGMKLIPVIDALHFM